MSLKYVYQSDRSELQRDPLASGETIYEGEFVTRNSSGEIARFDPVNDSLPDGIIVHDPRGDSVVKHDEDYVSYSDLWKYKASEGDRAYYLPLTQGTQIMPITLTDNGTDPEPVVDDGTKVGIVTINTQTEIVESGYTDNGGTTYSESGAGDFVALGRIYQQPTHVKLTDNYGQRVPVQLDAKIFQP